MERRRFCSVLSRLCMEAGPSRGGQSVKLAKNVRENYYRFGNARLAPVGGLRRLVLRFQTVPSYDSDD